MERLRVLHVAAPASPGSGGSMLRLLGATIRASRAAAEADPPRWGELQQEVLLLGPAGCSDLARAAELGAHRRLPPLLGVPSLSMRAFRRALERLRADLIHAWDAESAFMVARAGGGEALAVTLGCASLTQWTAPLSMDRAEVLCLGDRARREAIVAGWLHARVRVAAPPILDLHAAHDAALSSERARLRERWKIGEKTLAALVLTDPWSATDGKVAFDTAGRSLLAAYDVRLVIHPRTVASGEIRRWADLTNLRRVFVEDPEVGTPWRLFPGADAALVPEARRRAGGAASRWFGAIGGPPSGPLSAYWAARAGLPVVAPKDGPLEGLLPEGAMESVEWGASAGAIALNRLSTDRQWYEQMRGLARGAHPDPDAEVSRWASEIRELYGRAAAAAGVRWSGSRSDSAALE